MIEWFDGTVLDWFLSVQNPVLTVIMKVFTLLGEGGAVWIVLGLILLARRETRKTGAVTLLALLFCLITGNLLLKNIVARPRPCWVNPSVRMLIAVPKDYSFPSGHTMSAFAAVTALFFRDKRWGAVALCGAVLVAASRMYFYVHYPTDILAGLLIGILLGCLAAYLIHILTQRRQLCWK